MVSSIYVESVNFIVNLILLKHTTERPSSVRRKVRILVD
jgi:hypothetical protein